MMSHEPDWSEIWALARIFRTATNRELFDHNAPSDSNVLTEAWPTNTGAAFCFERHGRKWSVIIAPEESVGVLAAPDYSNFPDPPSGRMPG